VRFSLGAESHCVRPIRFVFLALGFLLCGLRLAGSDKGAERTAAIYSLIGTGERFGPGTLSLGSVEPHCRFIR